jgi:hypothetical protein
MWSRKLVNKEAVDHWGLLRQKKKIHITFIANIIISLTPDFTIPAVREFLYIEHWVTGGS